MQLDKNIISYGSLMKATCITSLFMVAPMKLVDTCLKGKRKKLL